MFTNVRFLVAVAALLLPGFSSSAAGQTPQVPAYAQQVAPLDFRGITPGMPKSLAMEYAVKFLGTAFSCQVEYSIADVCDWPARNSFMVFVHGKLASLFYLINRSEFEAFRDALTEKSHIEPTKLDSSNQWPFQIWGDDYWWRRSNTHLSLQEFVRDHNHSGLSLIDENLFDEYLAAKKAAEKPEV